MADKKLTARLTEIDLYLRATANLYGYMPPIQFLAVFNRYHKEEKLLKKELISSAEKLNRKGKETYRIYENAIVSGRVSENIIDKAYVEQHGKRYYFPTEEEIKNFSDNAYFEPTPQVMALKNYISSRYTFSEERLNDILRSVVWQIVTDDGVDKILKILTKRGIAVNDMDSCQELIEITINLINNTRLWANCGYTPTEMHELFD